MCLEPGSAIAFAHTSGALMRVFAFSASLRAGSHNRRLKTLALQHLRTTSDIEITDVPFEELVAPNYNFDDQQASGFPEPTERLAQLFSEHDGVVVVSPEYNYGIPGTLKNAIDWLSRLRPVPTRGKHGLLMTASTSLVGGNRGAWALRVPLELLGIRLYPGMFSLAQADKAYGDDGRLRDDALQTRLEALLDEYVEFGKRLSVA